MTLIRWLSRRGFYDGNYADSIQKMKLCMLLYILLFLLFVTGDHCSCFSDDRFQPDTAIFKSDGSDVYAYILCTWCSGVVTTKTGF